MAIASFITVEQTALWPQGDIRDPLGTWGFRASVAGDASGEGVKVTAQVPEGQKASYVYTCYAAFCVPISQVVTAGGSSKCRLLTNWPNVDLTAGVQAYSHLRESQVNMNTNLSTPQGGPGTDLVGPNQRFILLFDPRPTGSAMDIVELEFAANLMGDTYAFEGYGYFWDRSVLNAPGGPRHPGAS